MKIPASMYLRTKNLPLYIFIAIAFLIGGPLQFLGIVSPTQTNYVALLACLVYLVSNGITMPSRSEMLLFGIALFIYAGIVYNGSRLQSVLVYTYYLACPLIAVRTAKMAISKGAIGSYRTFYMILIATLALQAVAVITQSFFADQLISIAAGDISRTDITSGTFFVKSDGSLAVFCAISTVLFLSSPLRLRWKLAAVALSGLVVYMSGSKAAQAYFPLAIMATLFYRGTAASRFRIPLRALAGLFLIIIVAILATKAQEVYAAFMSNLQDTYDYRYGDNQAQRFAPLGDMIFSPTSYLGNGALHYYNPLTGEWLYYSGFSLIYSFYYDFGLIGLVLISLYVGTMLRELSGSWVVTGFAFSAFTVFSITAFSLTDLSFFFFLAYACLHQRNLQQPDSSDMRSLH